MEAIRAKVRVQVVGLVALKFSFVNCFFFVVRTCRFIHTTARQAFRMYVNVLSIYNFSAALYIGEHATTYQKRP